MYEEAAQDDGPSKDQLSEITRLAKAQVVAEADVVEAERKLKAAKKALFDIQEKSLPDAMTAANMKQFKLADGTAVKIQDGLSASLTKEMRAGACSWLREHGFGDLVSEDVEISFGRGEEAKAKALVDELLKKGMFPSCKTDVNTARLKSFIKEQMEAGNEVPLDLFGAYPWKKSMVELPED